MSSHYCGTATSTVPDNDYSGTTTLDDDYSGTMTSSVLDTDCGGTMTSSMLEEMSPTFRSGIMSSAKPKTLEIEYEHCDDSFDEDDEVGANHWSRLTVMERFFTSKYTPTAAQMTIMEQAYQSLVKTPFPRHVLVQSPTGSGKSVALLAVINRIVSTTPNQQFIIASPTHKQLRQLVQVVKEHYGSLTAVVIGARDKSVLSMLVIVTLHVVNCALFCFTRMCIHKGCGELVKKGWSSGQACSYSTDAKRGQNRCTVKKKFGKPLPHAVDMEDLVTEGTKRNVCPSFGALELAKTADIVLVPTSTLLSYSKSVPVTGRIVVFDEAHQIFQAACQKGQKGLKMQDLEISKATVRVSLTYS